MFENFLGNLKEKFEKRQERKEEERLDFARMQREVDFEAKKVFQEEFIKNSKEVAISRAKKDAASKSGVQKMRAKNRLRNLQKNNVSPGSTFARFSQYTQRNLARREENMKASKERMEDAKKFREERLQGGSENPITKPPIRRPFGGPTGFNR